MGIFLRHNWNVEPPRWGSPADVQYAIRVNSEKIYGCNPDNDVLVMPLFWGLPLLDYSGKNNYGTNHGATYKDGSLAFDGVNDYVEIPTYSTSNDETVSVFARIKPASFADYEGVVGNLVEPGYKGYVLYVHGDNTVGTYLSVHRRSTETLSLNSWAQIGFTFGAGDLRLYIKGSQVRYDGSVTYEGISILRIANFYVDSVLAERIYNGIIDSVHISNVVLTADQIALFHDRPWDLYRQVSRPIYFFQAAVGAWTGKLNGVTNPAKIMGVAVANISKVMGR